MSYNNTNNRIAIFAHYDSHNVIEDYVIYYLSELKKVVDKIIFVSDSNLEQHELEKVNNYVIHSIVGHHGEYDFGSYKRGYIYAKEQGLLNDIEEFILLNDSCYAPLFPFDEMFNQMSSQELDFWGVTSNPAGISIIDNRPVETDLKHIQSYFITFKPQVFLSNGFDSFMKNITHQETKEAVIAHYECGLTDYLVKLGFKYDVYCKLGSQIRGAHIHNYVFLIKKERSPFLKRSIALNKYPKVAYPFFLKKLITKFTTYDFNIIARDIKNNSEKIPILKKIFLHSIFIRRQIIRINFKHCKICLFGHWFYLKRRANEL